MKFSFVFLAISLSISTVSGGNARDSGPVTKIVHLLEALKEKSTNQQKVEQQIYDKYACWCEKTSKRKADDIEQAIEDLRELSQQILKLKGKIATLVHEIAELTEKIEANEEEQKKITAVREKENAAWQTESEETKQALAALQDAIKVLVAGTQGDKGAFVQMSAQMSRSAVTSVLDKLPAKVTVSKHHLSMLAAFAKSKAGYAPQSATIQGILVDMYSNFAEDLQSSTLDESNANHNFEDLYATLEKENNKMKKQRARKEVEIAETQDKLADTTKTYDDTQKQLEADKEFFDQMKEACEAKHEEWTTRNSLYEEELEGINKALEILTTDEARELFAKAIKPGVEAFLQIASVNNPALLQNSAAAPAAKAYNAVKTQAKKAHSIRLAALAVQIRTAKYGHFDEVIKAIDEMLKTLQEEGAADAAKKTQCLDQYQQIDLTVQDLDWKIKNNKAEIEKLEKLIELREKQKAETIKKIEETKKYMEDLTKERKEEHEAYLEAKKADNDAIKLLETAKEVFAEYYKKNKIHLGKIQGSVKGVLLAQEEPEFEVSADQAPDATFSHKGSNKLQGKDIISLFDYVIEDLQEELANEKKAEEKSQEEYEAEMATAQKLLDELKERKAHLTELIAKRKEDKEEETKDLHKNNDERDAELKYEAKIKPDCDWILKSFDERADARAAEMDGLTQAKEFLAGYQASQESSLLEKSKTFDDNALRSARFLGLSH